MQIKTTEEHYYLLRVFPFKAQLLRARNMTSISTLSLMWDEEWIKSFNILIHTKEENVTTDLQLFDNAWIIKLVSQDRAAKEAEFFDSFKDIEAVKAYLNK